MMSSRSRTGALAPPLSAASKPPPSLALLALLSHRESWYVDGFSDAGAELPRDGAELCERRLRRRHVHQQFVRRAQPLGPPLRLQRSSLARAR